MKISKNQLMEIIEEEFEKVKSGDIRKTYQTGIKQKTASGVSDQERGIIQQLQDQLAQAAKVGNIASGKVLRLANLLSQELSKVGTEEPSQREPQDRGGLEREPRPRDPQARKPSKRGQAMTVTREGEKREGPLSGAETDLDPAGVPRDFWALREDVDDIITRLTRLREILHNMSGVFEE